MEQTRKNLKSTSIIVLALGGLTLLNILFEVFFGEIKNADIPAGSPDNILLITQIFVVVLSLLMLLPQFYIGFKGLKMAKNPNASRGHIIWAIILFVFAIISMISPLIAIIKQESLFENISELLSMSVDVIILYEYIKYAKAVSKMN